MGGIKKNFGGPEGKRYQLKVKINFFSACG